MIGATTHVADNGRTKCPKWRTTDPNFPLTHRKQVADTLRCRVGGQTTKTLSGSVAGRVGNPQQLSILPGRTNCPDKHDFSGGRTTPPSLEGVVRPGRGRKNNLSVTERFDQQNRDCAEIILADVLNYGGDESGAVQWARLFMDRTGTVGSVGEGSDKASHFEVNR